MEGRLESYVRKVRWKGRLEDRGRQRERFGEIGEIWRDLKRFGEIWRALERFGRDLERFGKIWVRFGGISGHFA